MITDGTTSQRPFMPFGVYFTKAQAIKMAKELPFPAEPVPSTWRPERRFPAKTVACFALRRVPLRA